VLDPSGDSSLSVSQIQGWGEGAETEKVVAEPGAVQAVVMAASGGGLVSTVVLAPRGSRIGFGTVRGGTGEALQSIEEVRVATGDRRWAVRGEAAGASPRPWAGLKRAESKESRRKEKDITKAEVEVGSAAQREEEELGEGRRRDYTIGDNEGIGVRLMMARLENYG
jgi:hypothetical protein